MKLEERHIFGANGNYRIDTVNAPSNKTAIRFENVTKSYRDYKSDLQKILMVFSKTLRRNIPLISHLKNINLEIQKGEFVNICGNYDNPVSTLADITGGIVHPDFGRVWINGKVANAKMLKLSFESFLSPRENIKRISELSLVPREDIEKLTEEILTFAEIPSHLIDKAISKLSPKMLARLRVSYILHHNCEILIMESMLEKVDADFDEKASAKLKALLDTDARTVILCTRIPVIKSLIDRTLLFDEAEIIYEGGGAEAKKLFKQIEAEIIQKEKESVGQSSQ